MPSLDRTHVDLSALAAAHPFRSIVLLSLVFLLLILIGLSGSGIPIRVPRDRKGCESRRLWVSVLARSFSPAIALLTAWGWVLGFSALHSTEPAGAAFERLATLASSLEAATLLPLAIAAAGAVLWLVLAFVMVLTGYRSRTNNSSWQRVGDLVRGVCLTFPPLGAIVGSSLWIGVFERSPSLAATQSLASLLVVTALCFLLAQYNSRRIMVTACCERFLSSPEFQAASGGSLSAGDHWSQRLRVPPWDYIRHRSEFVKWIVSSPLFCFVVFAAVLAAAHSLWGNATLPVRFEPTLGDSPPAVFLRSVAWFSVFIVVAVGSVYFFANSSVRFRAHRQTGEWTLRTRRVLLPDKVVSGNASHVRAVVITKSATDVPVCLPSDHYAPWHDLGKLTRESVIYYDVYVVLSLSRMEAIPIAQFATRELEPKASESISSHPKTPLAHILGQAEDGKTIDRRSRNNALGRLRELRNGGQITSEVESLSQFLLTGFHREARDPLHQLLRRMAAVFIVSVPPLRFRDKATKPQVVQDEADPNRLAVDVPESLQVFLQSLTKLIPLHNVRGYPTPLYIGDCKGSRLGVPGPAEPRNSLLPSATFAIERLWPLSSAFRSRMDEPGDDLSLASEKIEKLVRRLVGAVTMLAAVGMLATFGYALYSWLQVLLNPVHSKSEEVATGLIKSGLTVLEMMILAPLAYLLMLGLSRYISAVIKNKDTRRAKAELLDFKSFEVALLISALAALIVSQVFKWTLPDAKGSAGPPAEDWSGRVLLLGGVTLFLILLVAYYWLLERFSDSESRSFRSNPSDVWPFEKEAERLLMQRRNKEAAEMFERGAYFLLGNSKQVDDPRGIALLARSELCELLDARDTADNSAMEEARAAFAAHIAELVVTDGLAVKEGRSASETPRYVRTVHLIAHIAAFALERKLTKDDVGVDFQAILRKMHPGLYESLVEPKG